MNNQMPYFAEMNPNQNMNQGFNPTMNSNYQAMMLERLNNRVLRLERQVRMLENKVNSIGGGNPTFLKNNADDNDNMYML